MCKYSIFTIEQTLTLIHIVIYAVLSNSWEKSNKERRRALETSLILLWNVNMASQPAAAAPPKKPGTPGEKTKPADAKGKDKKGKDAGDKAGEAEPAGTMSLLASELAEA